MRGRSLLRRLWLPLTPTLSPSRKDDGERERARHYPRSARRSRVCEIEGRGQWQPHPTGQRGGCHRPRCRIFGLSVAFKLTGHREFHPRPRRGALLSRFAKPRPSCSPALTSGRLHGATLGERSGTIIRQAASAGIGPMLVNCIASSSVMPALACPRARSEGCGHPIPPSASRARAVGLDGRDKHGHDERICICVRLERGSRRRTPPPLRAAGTRSTPAPAPPPLTATPHTSSPARTPRPARGPRRRTPRAPWPRGIRAGRGAGDR